MKIVKVICAAAFIGLIAAWGWWSVTSSNKPSHTPLSTEGERGAELLSSDGGAATSGVAVAKRRRVRPAIITSAEGDKVTKAILAILEEDKKIAATDAMSQTIQELLALLTDEERRIVELNLHLNRGDRARALEAARSLMNASTPYIRRQVVQALSWLGMDGAAALAQMLGDGDASVVADATEALLDIVDAVGEEELSAQTLFELLPSLENRELIDKALMNVTRMNVKNALETVSSLIEENPGNATLQKASRDMWSHLTGGEDYVNSNSVDDYIARKEAEQEKAQEFWREVAAAREAGDEARVRELLGLPPAEDSQAVPEVQEVTNE